MAPWVLGLGGMGQGMGMGMGMGGMGMGKPGKEFKGPKLFENIEL